MREATLLKDPTPLDDNAARGTAVRDAAVVVLRRNVTSNPAIETQASSGDDIEAWAWHARAANGLGDAGAAPAAVARPASYELQQAARTRRWSTLGDMIAAAMQAAGAIVRRAYARYRQRRQAGAFYDALRQLDDHTLRDLGFDRSELGSVAAEASGEAEHTRLRVVLAQTDPHW